jgi:hypothetical protein
MTTANAASAMVSSTGAQYVAVAKASLIDPPWDDVELMGGLAALALLIHRRSRRR